MGHDHHHHHEDHHDHEHHHDLRKSGVSRLRLVFIITLSFMFVEALGGYLTNSLSLMSDAAHMLTDSAALGLSLFAFFISSRPASDEKTYGYYRFEILAAFFNGVFLVLIAIAISWSAWQRFNSPVEVKAAEMLGIAIVGLLFNLLAARLLTQGGHHHHHNVKGALYHVLSDALCSIGAIIAALLMLFFGWTQADPIASWVIAGIILIGSARLVLDTFHMIMDGTPPHLDLEDIRNSIKKFPHVVEVHDLHVWNITSGLVSLSVHVVAEECSRHKLLCGLRDMLKDSYKIEHVTIQIEDTSLKNMEPSI